MTIKTLDMILCNNNDADVCNEVFLLYSEMNNKIDVSKMKKCKTIISLIWHSFGIIENGGFFNLISGNFKGDPFFIITANCYREIGIKDCYDSFVKIFNYYPNCPISEDPKVNIKILKTIGHDELTKIERKFYSAKKTLEKALCQYIRNNKDLIYLELKIK